MKGSTITHVISTFCHLVTSPIGLHECLDPNMLLVTHNCSTMDSLSTIFEFSDKRAHEGEKKQVLVPVS